MDAEAVHPDDGSESGGLFVLYLRFAQERGEVINVADFRFLSAAH